MRTKIEDAVGGLTGRGFRLLSAVRGAKSLHPHGLVFDATLAVTGTTDAPASPLLAEPAEHRALVRFSRSVGLPSPLPDVIGASIRLPDVHGPGRHQDFLFVTSIDRPVLHHVFVPVRDAQQLPYSSLAPYRVADELYLLGLEPRGAVPGGEGESLEDRLIDAAGSGRLAFDFSAARVRGRFTPIGELRIGDRREDALDGMPFNVWNTGAGLEPATVVNRVRRAAYQQSQKGWRQAS
jgi:hypothetical protein